MAPGTRDRRKDLFHNLAEVLRNEIFPAAILNHLEAVFVGINKPHTADKRALTFLRADGLPILISHLAGTATSRSGAMGRAISDKAAQCLLKLLYLNDTVKAELCIQTNVIPPLINALGVAPTVVGRSAAAAALHMFSKDQPKECMAMVEAGVVGQVLILFADIWNLTPDMTDPLLVNNMTEIAGGLMNVLLRSKTDAASRLRWAICAPHAAKAFTALLLVQVCQPCSHMTGPSHNSNHMTWKTMGPTFRGKSLHPPT